MKLADISHHEFNPVNTIVNSEKLITKVQFDLNGKTYKTELVSEDYDNDINFSFFEAVKQAVEENNLNGQFYYIYQPHEDLVSIIFLTKKQYDYVKANKIPLFVDHDWFEDE